MQRPRRSVSHHYRLRSNERGELVEFPACVELLPDPDSGVRENDRQEEGIPPVSEDQRQKAERKQNRVERRDRVSANDRRRRPTRGSVPLHIPRCESPCSLRLGQA